MHARVIDGWTPVLRRMKVANWKSATSEGSESNGNLNVYDKFNHMLSPLGPSHISYLSCN